MQCNIGTNKKIYITRNFNHIEYNNRICNSLIDALGMVSPSYTDDRREVSIFERWGTFQSFCQMAPMAEPCNDLLAEKQK